jgi:hypothetical protein
VNCQWFVGQIMFQSQCFLFPRALVNSLVFVQIPAVSVSEIQRKAKTKSLHSLIRDHGCLSGWDSFWQILAWRDDQRFGNLSGK